MGCSPLRMAYLLPDCVTDLSVFTEVNSNMSLVCTRYQCQDGTYYTGVRHEKVSMGRWLLTCFKEMAYPQPQHCNAFTAVRPGMFKIFRPLVEFLPGDIIP